MLSADATMPATSAEILTVCTGNICRSPLAELLLRTRLAEAPVRVRSAGTYGLDAAAMTLESQHLAVELGVRSTWAAAHRSAYLTERDLVAPDLILAMSREHRRRVVELSPARLRSAFTAREFARLAADAADDEILRAADAAGVDSRARVRASVAAVAAHRGIAPPPNDPEEDDVIDPYQRSWDAYRRSADELAPAIDQVVRVVRLAVG